MADRGLVDGRRVVGPAAAVALAVPCVVLVVQQFTQLGIGGTPGSDYAALQLGTRAFWKGRQLVGLYSREHWYHLGPIQFLWDGLFAWLPGDSFAEHQVAASVLACLAIAGLAVAARRTSATVGLVATAIVLVWWMMRFGVAWWNDPWNPVTAMWCTMLAVVCAAAIVAGAGRWWLLGLVVSGSAAVQAHVGAAPAVAVAAVTAVVVLVRQRRRGEPLPNGPRGRWVLAAGVTMWALPLIDLVAGGQWLWHTTGALLSGGDDATPMPADRVVSTAISVLGLSPPQQGHAFRRNHLGAGTDLFHPAILAMAAIGLALGLYALAAHRRQRFAATLAAMSLGGLVLTSIALVVAPGPYFAYLLFPVVALGPLLWVGGAVAIAHDLAARFPRLGMPVRWASVAAVLVAATVAMPPSRPALAVSYSNRKAARVEATLLADCGLLPRHAVVTTAGSWPIAAQVLVAVDRCTEMEVTGELGFFAGPTHEAATDAVPNVYIGPASSAPDGADIAVADDLVVRLLTS